MNWKLSPAFAFGIVYLITFIVNSAIATEGNRSAPAPHSTSVSAMAQKDTSCDALFELDIAEWNLAIKKLMGQPKLQAVSVTPPLGHLPAHKSWKFMVTRSNYPGLFQCVSYCQNQLRDKNYCRLEE